MSVKPIKRVTLYSEPNFQGSSFEMGVGELNINQIPMGVDNLSSLVIEPYTTVTLYAQHNLSTAPRGDGGQTTLTLSAGKEQLRVAGLYQPDKGWEFSNRAGSIKVHGGSQFNLPMMAAGAIGAYLALS